MSSRQLVPALALLLGASAVALQAARAGVETVSVADFVVHASDGAPAKAFIDVQDYRNVRVVRPDPPFVPENTSCVIVLHGGGSNGIGAAQDQTDLDALAGQQLFIVIYPESIAALTAEGDDRYNWNDGRDVNVDNVDEAPLGGGYPETDPNEGWSRALLAQNFKFSETDPEEARGVDDVGFLSWLVDSLIAGRADDPIGHYSCNPDRVYMAGLSNGGMMAQRFVLEVPGKIAAISSVVANLPEHLEHLGATAQPIPVQLMMGVLDPEQHYYFWDTYENAPLPLGPVSPVPSTFSGGWVCHSDAEDSCACRANIGRVNDVETTKDFWTTVNSCSERLPNVSLGNSTTLHRYQNGCIDDYQVLLYEIGEGGHTWPQSTGQFGICAGTISNDFAANSSVWQHFINYPYWDRDTTEECIQEQAGVVSGVINEGYWRGTLRKSLSTQDVAVTIRMRGIPTLKQLALPPNFMFIWRMYDTDATPPAWTSMTGMSVQPDGSILFNMAEAGRVLDGAKPQYLEIIAPDYDLNDDGFVNFRDLRIIKSAFFSTGIPETDFNRDGVTNFGDVGMLKSVFFQAVGCPTPGACAANVSACPSYPPH